MIMTPVHPLHYLLGASIFTPLILERWVSEPPGIKIRYLLIYFLLSIVMGIAYQSSSVAINTFGLFLIVIFIMSIPSVLLDPDRKGLLQSISDNFMNAILAFHAFFLLYFTLFNLTMITAVSLDFWSTNLVASAISASMGLLVGFSLQLANVINSRIPWAVVPVLSILISTICFKAMTSIQ